MSWLTWTLRIIAMMTRSTLLIPKHQLLHDLSPEGCPPVNRLPKASKIRPGLSRCFQTVARGRLIVFVAGNILALALITNGRLMIGNRDSQGALRLVVRCAGVGPPASRDGEKESTMQWRKAGGINCLSRVISVYHVRKRDRPQPIHITANNRPPNCNPSAPAVPSPFPPSLPPYRLRRYVRR